ncbi:spore germination protein [Halobacillus karajensis]|uniref:Spore germination protein A1 n=1 Tax=Halobacillus karajensis TaxID=195088 RepID=A0A024P0S2_9BACI|nr:spore germination protein [Halobacillus karajensis]CDQ19406.1 Spore germination protein A1 [Halobacillus karajensis]CDQ21869.1 Spore germination protein A1 [Halobacillus karajensis]CDQ27709.1 Spore germination protein A1 [Halobacillus karajensis]SEH83071.1 spore germination protein [Halobacillus karajensis]
MEPPINISQIIQEKRKNHHITIKKVDVGDHPVHVMYIPAIVDIKQIQDSILLPLSEWEDREKAPLPHSFSAEPLIQLKSHEDVDQHLLDGFTLLFERDMAYAVDSAQFAYRSIQEPVSEMTLRGSRDGFIESLEMNIALLRVHLRSTNLKFEEFKLGTRSYTSVSVAYIEGAANEELLQDVRNRLNAVKEDYIPDGGVVEQLIEKNNYSLFPEIQETERPTKVSSALVEGRVAIFVEGSPSVLLAPTTLNALFQQADDYNFKWIPASLIRLMRYMAALLAVMLPSIYISLISYHHGLIPTDLAISIAKTREGVPIPSFMEALIMQLTIEVLREAGIRLPKPIGPAVSIVGAIVLGEAAVTAGIVSPLMVIVVSFAAICSFTIADYALSLAFRTISFVMLLAAATLGIYGLILVIFAVSIHLIHFQSFSTPYLEPFAPFYIKRWKDSLIRFKLKKGGGRIE